MHAAIALEFNEKIAPALGVSYGGKIAMLPGQSKAEEFVTLVHETAHERLHEAERSTLSGYPGPADWKMPDAGLGLKGRN